MWRWLHSLPRALRYQLHGPRASAGICVDEDQCNENVNQPTPEAGREVKSTRQSWKSHCTCAEDGKKKGRSNHGTEGENFRNLVHGPSACLDAVGWGGALVLGIKISKFKSFYDKQKKAENQKLPSLLFKVACALPKGDNASVKHNILQADNKLQHDTAKAPKPPSALEKAALEFEEACRQYTAVGKSLIGVQKAKQGQITEAFREWSEASSLGYSKASFNLGLCYETGKGVKKNPTEAMHYYKKAAKLDHPEALYNLALLYMEGAAEVPEDTDKALELLERAASLGLTQAQIYLGVYHMEENSVDVKKAVEFFISAAEQQSVEGQYYLGVCYDLGIGVEENKCKAVHLYSQAAGQGHQGAINSLAAFHNHGLGGLPENKSYAKELLQKYSGAGSQLQDDLLLGDIEVDQSTGDLNQDGETEREESSGLILKMKSTVSSPSLTEYVRENMSKMGLTVLQSAVSPLGTVSQIYTQLITPRGYTVAPSVGHVCFDRDADSSSGGSSDSGVVFTLGSDEDERHYFQFLNNDDDLDQDDIKLESSRSLLNNSSIANNRHNTMPDLMAVTCT